jgi:hypothetical protein
LGLALKARGHRVLGVDKRANTWTQAFETEIVDLNVPAPQEEGRRRARC